GRVPGHRRAVGPSGLLRRRQRQLHLLSPGWQLDQAAALARSSEIRTDPMGVAAVASADRGGTGSPVNAERSATKHSSPSRGAAPSSVIGSPPKRVGPDTDPTRAGAKRCETAKPTEVRKPCLEAVSHRT